MHKINMANVSMLLPVGDHNSSKASPRRMFVCKTCSRQFKTFQALGDHRASHKKPRHDKDLGHLAPGKPKAHECFICGLEFAIGQALGGHMRRHRATPVGIGRSDVDEKKSEVGNRVLCLDLNFPPLDEVEERLNMGLGLGLGLEMMGCFH